MPDDPDALNTPPPAPADDPLAAALAALAPAPARLDRDRLMYAAGAESRRPTVRLWQATAGFLAAVGFAAGMYAGSPVVIERPTPAVPVGQTDEPPATKTPAPRAK